MNLFWFFSKRETKKETPKIKWAVVGSNYVINYNFNKDVYYQYYKKNPYIYSAINKLKNDIWTNWIEIQKKRWEDYIPVENSLLEEFISYKRNINLKSFLSSLVRDIEIFWDSYVFFAKNEGWKIIWVERVDPRYMTTVITETWQIKWYIQNYNWLRAFLPDEMLHLYEDIDLNDEKKWESKMQSLFLDLETDVEARESNLAFFKNNQTPASIVIIDKDYEMWEWVENGILNSLNEIFNSWDYTGGKNQHRTALLEWVKEIIKVQDKITDMEFIELRKFTRQMVYTVYQVNPDVLWITENSNRSVGESQSMDYWNTISSKEQLYEDFLTQIVKRIHWEEYRVEILQDSLRVLKQKAQIAWDLYKNQRVITLNEAREIIQYPEVEDWDNFFIETKKLPEVTER